MVARRLTLSFLFVASVAACDEDAPDPESVPFERAEPDLEPKPAPVAPPEPEPSASAAPKPLPVAPRPKAVNSSKLSSCCAALAALSRTAPDQGTRSNAEVASRVCATKVSEVREGKVSSEAALSQVRSSILGSAPSACR